MRILRQKLVFLLVFGTFFSLFSQENKAKTVFQIAEGWDADYDIRSDVAIVYGIHDAGGDFEGRVKSWRNKGYSIHFMTGIAWGKYKDYFIGEYDSLSHFDEGQKMRNGEIIWHGENMPYTVPTSSYLVYMKSIVKRAIDAGVSAIHLEEPEFWSRAGYSESFKEKWQEYYDCPWRPQHESPEATYLSSKLKYDLYFNALKEVFEYIHTYSTSIGKQVKCYVPTHSLINYASWNIVSPEASLAQLPNMDGYIAQVWTGTSREAIYFNGTLKERTFENAFLEYGSMVSMTAPTGRKMFFLTDPIEDRRQTWDDYKKNYQATFIAQLLYPSVYNYEVMPWANRIYKGKFKMEEGMEPQPLSRAYGTQMQVMINTLNNMPATENTLNGSSGINVLLANSIMFQRFPIHESYDDPALSNFYGLAMPLLKKGIPVGTVHMENLETKMGLKDTKVLLMTYSNMKPISEENHIALTKWVKNGGVLIYYGRDDDPFQNVKEWWNQNGNEYETPSKHLFELMGLEEKSDKHAYKVNKGKVFIIRQNPKELVVKNMNDNEFLEIVKEAYEKDANAGELEFKNYFKLERGPYDIIAVLDESISNKSLIINEPVIDLFDPDLPVLEQKIIAPGSQAFLFNINRVENSDTPQVLCSASRIYDEKIKDNYYSFIVKSPSNTTNSMRILLPSKPKHLKILDSEGRLLNEFKSSWDTKSRTYWLQFENNSNGIEVTIQL